MYIVNGECLAEMAKIEKHSVDMICCDLPYGETHNEWDKKIDIKALWKEMKRVCKPNANIILFCSTRFGVELIDNSGGCFCYDLVWEKSKAQGFLGAKKTPLRSHEMVYVFCNRSNNDFNREFNLSNRAYAKKCVEYVGVPLKQVHASMGDTTLCHFLTHDGQQFSLPTRKNYDKFAELWKLHKMEGYMAWDELRDRKEKNSVKPRTYNPQMTEGKPYKSAGGGSISNYGKKRTKATNNNGTRYPKSVLKFAQDAKSVHPTQKPIELCRWLVRTYSNPGDIVLDMTMGSGSSIVAAKMEGRAYIGIELDEKIFEVAESRVNALNKSVID